jgi:hypothetical protein
LIFLAGVGLLPSMACAVDNGFPAVLISQRASALLLGTGDLHPLARHPQQRLADRRDRRMIAAPGRVDLAALYNTFGRSGRKQTTVEVNPHRS